MLGEITFSAGTEGFQKLSEDPRNLIVASCMKELHDTHLVDVGTGRRSSLAIYAGS